MEKLSRPCLEVSRPLSIVRFEHHTWEVGNLIRSVISPRAELKHGQQTHQQPTSEHHFTKLTSNKNLHYRTLFSKRQTRRLCCNFLQRSQRQLRGNQPNGRIRTSYDYFRWSCGQRLTPPGLKKRISVNVWTFIVKAASGRKYAPNSVTVEGELLVELGLYLKH